MAIDEGEKGVMNAKDLHIEYHQHDQQSCWFLLAQTLVRWDAWCRAVTDQNRKDAPMRVYTESKFLKYQDLGEQDHIVTVREVKREDIKSKDGGMSKKFVVYFEELDKGLALNTTNLNTLCKLMGSDDSDRWVGQRITLYVKDDVEYGGELVSGIRIRPKRPA
jgi:hypothetical protein